MKLTKRETGILMGALSDYPHNDEIDALRAKIEIDADPQHDLLRRAIEYWDGQGLGRDENINGADAVDWLCDFITEARSRLSEEGK